jgi:hypothetical protein
MSEVDRKKKKGPKKGGKAAKDSDDDEEGDLDAVLNQQDDFLFDEENPMRDEIAFAPTMKYIPS